MKWVEHQRWPNTRTIGPFGRRDERPLEPCPGCAKVDLMTIGLEVAPRITPIFDLSSAVQVTNDPVQI